MQRLEVSGAVRPIYVSLGVKRLTVLTLPPFFLTAESVSSKLFTHSLYGMSWQHFTVSMNPEFLAKFTFCSYKMILLRKHAVHQSTTPFQSERYSRPCHLAASFSFPAHAKNRKTPLPNRPIHWQTLYKYFVAEKKEEFQSLWKQMLW